MVGHGPIHPPCASLEVQSSAGAGVASRLTLAAVKGALPVTVLAGAIGGPRVSYFAPAIAYVQRLDGWYTTL